MQELVDCPFCGGQGAVPFSVAECCGRPGRDGSCCGDAVEGVDFNMCQYCETSGKVSAKQLVVDRLKGII